MAKRGVSPTRKTSDSKKFREYEPEVNSEALVEEINQQIAKIHAKHRITKEIAQRLEKTYTIQWISTANKTIKFGYKKPTPEATKPKIVYEIRSIWTIKKINGTFGEICKFVNRLKPSDAVEFLRRLQKEVDRKHVEIGEKFDDAMTAFLEQPFPGAFFQGFHFSTELGANIIARGINCEVSTSKSLQNVKQKCIEEEFRLELVYSKDRMEAQLEKFGFAKPRPGKFDQKLICNL